MAIATTNGSTVARPRSSTPQGTTVHEGADGSVCHTRCGSAIAFRGHRGGQEIDFYCPSCHEHITLPAYVLTHLPKRDTVPTQPQTATAR